MDTYTPHPRTVFEQARRDGFASPQRSLPVPSNNQGAPAMGGCDTIVAGSQTLTAMFRRLAIRRTSQGFEVVHRYAGEWVGVTYPACVRKALVTAQADLAAHVEKDADRKRDRGV